MGKDKIIGAGRKGGNYAYIHFYTNPYEKSSKKKKKKKKKPDISREQHSKQAKIRQVKLWKVTQKV